MKRQRSFFEDFQDQQQREKVARGEVARESKEEEDENYEEGNIPALEKFEQREEQKSEQELQKKEEDEKEEKDYRQLVQFYNDCKLSNVGRLLRQENGRHFSKEELDDFLHHHLFRPLGCMTGQNQFLEVKNDLLPLLQMLEEQESKEREGKEGKEGKKEHYKKPEDRKLYQLFKDFISTVDDFSRSTAVTGMEYPDFFNIMFLDILKLYDANNNSNVTVDKENFNIVWRTWKESYVAAPSIALIPFLVPHVLVGDDKETSIKKFKQIFNILFLLSYHMGPFRTFLEYFILEYKNQPFLVSQLLIILKVLSTRLRKEKDNSSLLGHPLATNKRYLNRFLTGKLAKRFY
jgi:hypothetical protein